MPFRLLDRIVDLGDGGVGGRMTLRGDEAYLADHFPGFPVMPGALVVEAMVQAARALLWRAAAVRAHPVRRLEGVRFIGMVRPGDELEVRVRPDGAADGLSWFRGEASVGARRVAQARFALGDEALSPERTAAVVAAVRRLLAEPAP